MRSTTARRSCAACSRALSPAARTTPENPGRRSAGGALEELLHVARDQARAALVAQVHPGPFEEDHEAVPEADEEKEMHQQPRHPGEEPGHPDVAALGHGAGAANRSERTLVQVMKGL